MHVPRRTLLAGGTAVHLPCGTWSRVAFMMRKVLPWVKLGLAETSAELWSFSKRTRWGFCMRPKTGSFAGKVLSHHPAVGRGKLPSPLGWGVHPWSRRVAGGG